MAAVNCLFTARNPPGSLSAQRFRHPFALATSLPRWQLITSEGLVKAVPCYLHESGAFFTASARLSFAPCRIYHQVTT
jgi:hypothetical protein